jgi:hypothetical protein
LTFEVPETRDYSIMLSVLYALLEAVSQELDIERNDVRGCLYKIKLENGMLVNSVVLYDTAAGGAGHIRRIITKDGEMLSRVIERAVSLMDSCDCEPSCYSCLRNYYNQKIHDKLNRKAAANFLREFTGTIKTVHENVESSSSSTGADDTKISIIDSTPLKDEYPNWSEAAFLFEDYEGLTETMIENKIPIADCFEVELQVDSYTIEALLLWEDRKFVLCKKILSDDEKSVLNSAGWSWMDVAQLNPDKLAEVFGGVPNGENGTVK